MIVLKWLELDHDKNNIEAFELVHFTINSSKIGTFSDISRGIENIEKKI